jgi:hypothetical protein
MIKNRFLEIPFSDFLKTSNKISQKTLTHFYPNSPNKTTSVVKIIKKPTPLIIFKHEIHEQ